ncbi:MAG: hypothetical protein V7606_2406 [Burkholderiales bacterium]
MPGAAVLARIQRNHFRGFFSDHDDRRVDIARHKIRHDRGVNIRSRAAPEQLE